MPKRLTREQRLAKRREWMNSPQSLNGCLLRLERKLLERCIKARLGVKGIARRLHVGPMRVRYLLRKHNLRLSSQPTNLTEYNARLKAEKETRLKSTRSATCDRGCQGPLKSEQKMDGQCERHRLESGRDAVPTASVKADATQAPAIDSPVPRPAPKPAPIIPSPTARRNLDTMIALWLRHDGCNHRIALENTCWVTSTRYVCATCHPQPKEPENPVSVVPAR